MNKLPTDLIPLPTMPYDERPSSLPLDVEECRTALWLDRGNISKAAERLKISPVRLRSFVSKSPRLTEEQNEAREQILDIAEDVVHEALTDEVDASRRDQMARFAITNLGHTRGYGKAGPGPGVNLSLGRGKLRITWESGDEVQADSDDDPKTIEGEYQREATG